MSFVFYATPEEQRHWLMEQIEKNKVWMVGWSFGRKYFEIRNPDDLKSLSFDAKHVDNLIIYLGRYDLARPVWQRVQNENRIDFINSQSIQFVPSLPVGKDILLEGRVGIMRPSEYKVHGIDPAKISQWYRKTRESLSSIMLDSVVIIQKTTTGKVKEWPAIRISPGAVARHRKGGLLKQFPDGAVQFEIKEKRKSGVGIGGMTRRG
jgi:hypothetical protein